mgnify:FL=1
MTILALCYIRILVFRIVAVKMRQQDKAAVSVYKSTEKHIITVIENGTLPGGRCAHRHRCFHICPAAGNGHLGIRRLCCVACLHLCTYCALKRRELREIERRAGKLRTEKSALVRYSYCIASGVDF